MSPFIKKNNGINNGCPCGRCPHCLSRRASGWGFRLARECSVSSSAYFITFTYDNSSAPLSVSRRLSLYPPHIQLFMKKLRHRNESKLKYYCAGEYGGKTFRPHYHMILFNSVLDTFIPPQVAYSIKSGLIPLDGQYHITGSLWEYGFITIGQVTDASTAYTLKYISKTSRVPQYKGDDRCPEFSLMSKGLGISYVTDAMKKWHKDDLLKRVFCNLEDGKKISMPRYYKDKIYDRDERNDISAMAPDCTPIDFQTASDTVLNSYAKDMGAMSQAYNRFALKNKSKNDGI